MVCYIFYQHVRLKIVTPHPFVCVEDIAALTTPHSYGNLNRLSKCHTFERSLELAEARRHLWVACLWPPGSIPWYDFHFPQTLGSSTRNVPYTIGSPLLDFRDLACVISSSRMTVEQEKCAKGKQGIVVSLPLPSSLLLQQHAGILKIDQIRLEKSHYWKGRSLYFYTALWSW